MTKPLDVSTAKHLDVPPAKVFALLESAAGIAAWWAPMTVRKKTGPDSGAGLVVVFESGGAVTETWTLRSVTPQERVVYDVDFAGQLVVERTLAVVADGAGARVTWRETAQLPDAMPAMPGDELVKSFGMALALLEKAARRG